VTLTGPGNWQDILLFTGWADPTTIRIIGTRGTATGTVDIAIDGAFLQTNL
jgi:hypothetical protein